MKFNLFPTYIYQAPLKESKDLNKSLKQEVQQIRELDFEGQEWSQKHYFGGYTSYASMGQLHLSSPNFMELEKLIRKHVLKFAKELEWDFDPRDLHMNSCWVNMMPKGTHHSFHIHPLSVISGTFYLDMRSLSSPIKFEDPRLSKFMACPPRKEKAKLQNQNFVSIRAKNSDIVLFESWLRHEVPANSTEHERISISFNYGWR